MAHKSTRSRRCSRCVNQKKTRTLHASLLVTFFACCLQFHLTAQCNPAGCNPPVWTPVDLPIFYSFKNPQPVQPQNGVYSFNFSNESIGGDGVTVDGTYPSASTSPPAPPWWWANCDQNGNCQTDLAGTARFAYLPEARSQYGVTSDQVSPYFRGFEFLGNFQWGTLPNTTADVAVFYNSGFDFSGGFEYGFRFTQASYPLEFYYTINSNCGCGGGFPCPQSVQCKASDTQSGSLTSEHSGSVPLPTTIQSGVNDYFHTWVYYDYGVGRYRLKLDVLDQSFHSLCTGQPCGAPIDPPYQIPTDLSWGHVYALVKKVSDGNPPPSPTLKIQQFKVGKNSSAPPESPYDINDDGKQDLVVYYSGSTGYEYSLLSMGAGSFNPIAAGGINPSGGGTFDTVVQADFNGDGKGDILFYSSASGTLKVGIGDGAGNFTYAQPTTISPGYNVAARGDFDHDGKTDLLWYRQTDGLATVALSNGDGTFNNVGQTFSPGFTTVAVGDYNGDGTSDVILYNNQVAPYNAYLLLGNGTGNFTSSGSLFFGQGFNVYPADLNADGKTDFVLYRPSDGTTFVAMSSGTSFTYTYNLYSPGFTAFKIGDVNGDGFPDLVLYNSANANGYLLLGDGQGHFPNSSSLFFGSGFDFVDLRDFNGDGKQDVIIYRTADGTSFAGISSYSGSSGGNFYYTYNYFGPQRIVAK